MYSLKNAFIKRLAMKNIVKIIVFLVVASVYPATFAADVIKKEALDVRVINAFFYVPLGSSKSTMVFFTITNYSNTNLSVTGVSSQAAKQVRLMPENSWALPAKQSLVLKSSGRYVQITDLKTRLSTGDELHLEVSLSNGQTLHIVALAKSAYDQVHSR
jgi:copper(I)-binding protein